MIRHSGTLSLFGIEMSAVVLPLAIFWEAVSERAFVIGHGLSRALTSAAI